MVDLDVLDSIRRIEALVFANGVPTSYEKICRCVVAGVDPDLVIDEIARRYNGVDCSLVLVCKPVAGCRGGYCFELDPRWLQQIRSHEEERVLELEQELEALKLGPYSLELLGHIVVNQPVSIKRLEELTGRRCRSDSLDKLLKLNFVEEFRTKRGRRKERLFKSTSLLLESLGGFNGSSIKQLAPLIIEAKDGRSPSS